MCDETEQPLEVELQSLEAIYVNELTFSRNDDGSVETVEVLIHPATGHDATKQFVCMTLVFVPGPKYPDEIPDIEIRNPRGLGEEEVVSLLEALILKGEEVKGEVMMYTLIEMAKDSLTEGNIPHCPCVVCLEHFHQQDGFHRTACYHYFHTSCLYKYVQHTRAQLEEEKKEAMERRHVDTGSSETRTIVCPLCRRELDESLLSVTWSDDGTKDEAEFNFVMPQEMREQQKKMAEVYERQKAKGGIIDPEQEKNKFLVNYEDRFFVYDAAPSQTAETQSVKEHRTDKKKGRNKRGGMQQHSHQKSSGMKHSSHATLEVKRFHKSARSNVHGARLPASRKFESVPHRSGMVSSSGLEKQEEELQVDEVRDVSDVGACSSKSGSSGDSVYETKDGSVSESTLESIGRLNIECAVEAGSVQPGIQTERQTGATDAETATRMNEIKFKKWDSKDALPNRQNQRSPEKFGLLGSVKGGSDSWHQDKSGWHDGSKQYSQGARGHSGKAYGRYYDHHHPQYTRQHTHRENWRQHERHRESGERRQQLGERQQGIRDSVGQSSDGKETFLEEKSLDSEAQDDADGKYFHINGKWRPSNFKPSGAKNNENCGFVSGAHYSNYNNLFHDKFGLLENKENICSNKAVGIYDDLEEYYVGFGSMEKEDEWENEIDPFAFERTRIRRKKLESYDEIKKADLNVYEKRLEERLSTETMVLEEERRMQKERRIQKEDVDECKTYNSEKYLMETQMKVCGKEFNFVRGYKLNRTQDSDLVSRDLVRKVDDTDTDLHGESDSTSGGSDVETSGDLDVDLNNIEVLEGDLCDVQKMSEPQALPKQDVNQPEPLLASPVVKESISLAHTSAMLCDRKTASLDSKRRHVKKAPPLVLPKRAKQTQDSVLSSVIAQSQDNVVSSDSEKSQASFISAVSALTQASYISAVSALIQASDVDIVCKPSSQANDVNQASCDNLLYKQSQASHLNLVDKPSQANDVNPASYDNALYKQSRASHLNLVDKTSQANYVNPFINQVVMSSAVPPAKHKFVKTPALNLAKKSKAPAVKEIPTDIQAIIREMNLKPQNSEMYATTPVNRLLDSNHMPFISLPPSDPSIPCLDDLFSRVKLPQPAAHFSAPPTQGVNNEAFLDAYYKALGLIPDQFVSSGNSLTEDLASGSNTKRNK